MHSRMLGARAPTLFEEHLRAELSRRFRVPPINNMILWRALCLTGRACSAMHPNRRSVMVWLCVEAPFWVVVRVCALLA